MLYNYVVENKNKSHMYVYYIDISKIYYCDYSNCNIFKIIYNKIVYNNNNDRYTHTSYYKLSICNK